MRDIKERTCGNSMGHQLKEWNFQGVHKKLVEFLWVLIFELWNFHQQGQNFHSIREVKESQENQRFFGKQKSEEKVKNIFIHANFQQ